MLELEEDRPLVMRVEAMEMDGTSTDGTALYDIQTLDELTMEQRATRRRKEGLRW